MTVDGTNNRTDYDPDGATSTFIYDFRVDDADDMVVYADGVLYTEPFSITGLGNELGGDVIFDVAPVESIDVLTLIREVPLTQQTSYPPLGPFPAGSHEQALDKLTFIVQQHQELLDRAGLAGVDADPATSYTLPPYAAGEYWFWDPSAKTIRTSLISPIGGGSGGIQVRNNVEELRSIPVPSALYPISTLGHTFPGDGGGHLFVGKTGEVPGFYTDKNGSVIVPDGGDGSSAWVWSDSSILDLRGFGFTGTGDETSTIQTAIDEAPDGGKITSGGKYSFSCDQISIDNKTLSIDFNESEVSQTDLQFIKATGSFRSLTAVSSLSSTPEGLTVLTMADTGLFELGDIIKVTSTDEQPDFWVAGRYIGQFSNVFEKTATTLTLDMEIEDIGLYLNNVTVGILNNHTVSVKNLIVDAGSLSNQSSTVEYKDLVGPILENVISKNNSNKVFVMTSCYKYYIHDCNTVNSLDDEFADPIKLGYTVMDASSHGGLITGLKSYGARHAFTNNSYLTSGGVDMSCGYTTNTLVVDGESHNAQAGSWDTHPGALDVIFANCSSFNSLQFGQSRSRRTKFVKPYGRNIARGLVFSTGRDGSTINPLQNVRIISPDFECTENFILHYKNSTTDLALTQISDIIVIGGVVTVNSAERGPIMSSRFVPILFKLRDFYFYTSSVVTDGLIFGDPLDNYDIEIKNVTLKTPANALLGSIGLVKFNGDATALVNRVVVEDTTFLGDGWVDETVSVVINADALIDNVKIEDIGTGSFTAVTSGTRLIWGGEL